MIVLAQVATAFAKAPQLGAYQGAWLEQGLSCDEVFANGQGKFKTPVSVFAPAFIIRGSTLRTPQASCRIVRVSASEGRDLISLSCANSVATADVKALLKPGDDGTLVRFMNEADKVGDRYRRCPAPVAKQP
jgi:hypothetical protein